jgi:uncharacterized protein Yka (UPF0111/DUF47 family)
MTTTPNPYEATALEKIGAKLEEVSDALGRIAQTLERIAAALPEPQEPPAA